MRLAIGVALIMSAEVFGCAPAVMIPAACVGNDTTYVLTLADTLRGFRLASPRSVVLPPSTFRGSGVAHVVVDHRGAVVADKTWIEGAQSREDSLALVSTAKKVRFVPATHGGCAVISWYWIRFQRHNVIAGRLTSAWSRRGA